jgi:hypothetical protein
MNRLIAKSRGRGAESDGQTGVHRELRMKQQQCWHAAVVPYTMLLCSPHCCVMVQVKEGAEPSMFTAHFLPWRADQHKLTTADYEAKIAAMRAAHTHTSTSVNDEYVSKVTALTTSSAQSPVTPMNAGSEAEAEGTAMKPGSSPAPLNGRCAQTAMLSIRMLLWLVCSVSLCAAALSMRCVWRRKPALGDARTARPSHQHGTYHSSTSISRY